MSAGTARYAGLLSAGLGTSLPNPAQSSTSSSHRSRIVAAHAATPAKSTPAVNAACGMPARPRRQAPLASRAAAARARAEDRRDAGRDDRHRDADGLRPDHRRGCDAAELQHRRHGHDGRGDRHRRGLQQPGAWAAASAPAPRSSPATTSPTGDGRPAGDHVAARHLRGRPDRRRRPRPPGRRARGRHRGPEVTGDNNAADLSSIADALQWVVDHHAEYNITVVNMSLSDGGNYARNWFAQDGGVGQRITGLSAAQDDEHPRRRRHRQQLQRPAGRGLHRDRRRRHQRHRHRHQRQPRRQRPAPGLGRRRRARPPTSPPPARGSSPRRATTGYSTVDGTSFAAPLVSGSVVLLQQLYQSRFHTLPTVDQITGWLEQGADPVYDSVTGITIGRLDLAKSASLVPGASVAPPPVVVTPPAGRDASAGRGDASAGGRQPCRRS